MEKESAEKEAKKMQHENRNFKARLSHATATGKVPMATSSSDQKRIQELQDNVEALTVKNAVRTCGKGFTTNGLFFFL